MCNLAADPEQLVISQLPADNAPISLWSTQLGNGWNFRTGEMTRT